MKVISIPREVSKFQPVTFTVSLETQEEVNLFSAIMGLDVTIPKVLVSDGFDAALVRTTLRRLKEPTSGLVC